MSKFLPIPDWLVSYRRDWLRLDVIAGLTTAAVIIPKAMAYAMMAGLPVQVGLYAALVPMLIYALLGTSRGLSVSTTTTLAILTAAQLGQIVHSRNPKDFAPALATLTLLVGAALILACVLRLGFVANFISEPVLIGFKAGIGLVIVVDQIPKVLGIHFPRGTFLHSVAAIVHNLPKTSLATFAVAAYHGAVDAWNAGASSGSRGCGCRRVPAAPASARSRTGGPTPSGLAICSRAKALAGT